MRTRRAKLNSLKDDTAKLKAQSTSQSSNLKLKKLITKQNKPANKQTQQTIKQNKQTNTQNKQTIN